MKDSCAKSMAPMSLAYSWPSVTPPDPPIPLKNAAPARREYSAALASVHEHPEIPRFGCRQWMRLFFCRSCRRIKVGRTQKDSMRFGIHLARLGPVCCLYCLHFAELIG